MPPQEPASPRNFGATPVNEEDLDRLARAPQETVALLPDAHLVVLGTSSVVDPGGPVLRGLLDEIAGLKTSGRYKLILGVGGGVRARHVMTIGRDVDLPTGGLAAVVGAAEEQTQRLVASMLARVGGVGMNRLSPLNYRLYLEQGCMPVILGSPPFHFWEPPPRWNPMVDHGPDFGLMAVAEVLGVASLTFVKDVDGVYDRDPRVYAGAVRLERVHVDRLLGGTPDGMQDGPSDGRGFETLPLERAALEFFQNARRVPPFRVIDGRVRGALSRALAGEDVGTLIHK